MWHHHPECEITLVLRGGTERFGGDRLTPLAAGDLVLLGPDVPHNWRNQPIAGKRPARVEAIVVQFMPHLLGEDWLKRASMQPLRRLFDRSRRGLHVTGRTRDVAAQHPEIVARLKKAFDENQPTTARTSAPAQASGEASEERFDGAARK